MCWKSNGEIEPETFIIPDNIVQELPAAIKPPDLPENIKPCDLLDDFDDFISANPSANSSPIPQEAFSTTSSSLSKALRSHDKENWKKAIIKECESMKSNKVWIEVEDTGQRRIYSFVVLRIKPDDDGSGPKHKARIAKGCW